MKFFHAVRTGAIALAALGMLIPSTTLLAATTVKAKTTQAETSAAAERFDVGLHQDNLLFGQVVDAQGVPQASVPIQLIQKNRVLITVKTDPSGFFAISKIPPATYQVKSGKMSGTYRLWAPKTAPAEAQAGVMMVVGQGPVRAQQGPIGYWFGKVWEVAGLIVSKVVAIPLAIHGCMTANPEETW